MTQITQDDVLHLAQLSALSLDEDEAVALTDDIKRILDYVELLDELDIDAVEPTYQVTDLQNIGREDIVIESPVSRESLVSLSSGGTVTGQVKVPKVL